MFKGFLDIIFNIFCLVFDVMKGVLEFLCVFKYLGVKIVVVFGGFFLLIGWLVGEFGIDYVYVNEVVIEDGKLMGEVKGIIVGKECK